MKKFFSFFIFLLLPLSIFFTHDIAEAATCVWNQYEDVVLNDYLEVRNCINLPPAQNACTAPDSSCGAGGGWLGWGDKPTCPPGIVDEGVSSRAHNYKCYTDKTESPIGFQPEQGMCYAKFAFTTVCTVTAPTVTATANPCGSVTTAWPAVTGATSYVYTKNGGVTTLPLGASDTSYTDSSVTPGSSYTFGVKTQETGNPDSAWGTDNETAPVACVAASVQLDFQ